MKTKEKIVSPETFFIIKKLFDRYVTKVQKLSTELVKQVICATDSVKTSKIFESH